MTTQQRQWQHSPMLKECREMATRVSDRTNARKLADAKRFIGTRAYCKRLTEMENE